MNTTPDTKPVWLIVEPLFFLHSVGYLRSILENNYIRENYNITYVYGQAFTDQKDPLHELREAFGDSFVSLKVEQCQSLQLGYRISALALTWRTMRKANRIAGARKIANISVLRLDDFIRILAIPFTSLFFANLRGATTGVFFNSRCFREEGILPAILAKEVCRVMKSDFFKKVLFLDHGVCDTVKSRLDTTHKKVVGEAVDPWTIESEKEIEDATNDNSLITLLIFGAHSRRKGSIHVLKMFKDYPKELADYKLLIVGPIREDIRDEFDAILSDINHDGEKIECVDRYITDDDSWAYFKRSDIVVCPYWNFHGSSNVLIRAAAAGLPVVAPEFGFLGELVTEKKIGATFKTHDALAMLEAVTEANDMRLQEREELRARLKAYADFHKASNYATNLLGVEL